MSSPNKTQFFLQECKTLYKTQYIHLKCIDFTVQKEHLGPILEGSWFFVERQNQTQAVVIIPYIRSTDQIILIRQFRVPFWKYIIEFPAGLMDEGESVVQTALRELKEETGYTGKVIYQSPLLAVSAGLTNEMATYCLVEVDEIPPGKQNLEIAEDIEVLCIPKKDLLDFLQKRIKIDDIIDCKVFLILPLLNYFQEE